LFELGSHQSIAMAFLAKALPIVSTLIIGISATLPASYDVAWTTPGVNGSADSMPLGGGDIGVNTWFEDSKLLFILLPNIKDPMYLVFENVVFLVQLFLEWSFRGNGLINA
jgi:hypothetical protein